jgi:hypothetical protein
MTQMKINGSAPATETDIVRTVDAATEAAPVKRTRRAAAASGNTALPAASQPPKDNDVPLIKELPVTAPEERVKELESALQKLAGGNEKVDVYIGDYSDILKYIGAILIKNADAMRQSALNDRLAAREAARLDLLGQSDKLHEAAATALKTAVVMAAINVAFASLSIIGSTYSLKSSLKTLKINQEEATALKNNKIHLEEEKSRAVTRGAEESEIEDLIAQNKPKLDKIAKDAEAERAASAIKGQKGILLRDASNSVGGAARSIEAGAQAHVRVAEADATRDAANAQYAQQQADIKKDIYDKVLNLLQQSISIHREMLNSQAEAMRAVTRA